MTRDELIQIILGHGQLSEGALADAILAEIEKLRAENEALMAKLPRWIPVTERLPEPGVDVLVVSRVYGVTAAALDNLSDWYAANTSYNVRMPGTTHWMPLPDAPEQEPAP